MGSVISGLFGSGSSTTYTNSITARDILPEAKSTDPESPIFGGSNSSRSNISGKDSLMVDAAYTKKVSPTSYSKNSLLIQ